MVKLITDVNAFNYSGDGVDRSRWKSDADGVDRSRWKFDEKGFKVATDKAIETARRQIIMAADDENQKVIKEGRPSSVVRSIDGVDNAPVDAFKL